MKLFVLDRIRAAKAEGASHLDLSSAGLTEIPKELNELTNLTSLDVGGNSLGAEGARVLSKLTNLTSLDVGLNGLEAEGARALSTLTNLTSLNVGYNSLGDDGARSLSTLTNLTSLNVGVNRLTSLEGLRPLLEQLRDLRIDDCPIVDPPPSVWQEADDVLQAVRAHYRDRALGEQHDAEFKVCVLGNGHVGKTQMCRRLKNKDFNPKIKTTHGIFRRRKRFNGATLLQRGSPRMSSSSACLEQSLQWGHASSAWITPALVRMSLSLFPLQWGHASSAWITLSTPRSGQLMTESFNGATLLQRGSPCLEREAPRARQTCFNGATLLQRGSPNSGEIVPPSVSVLQWGHASSAWITWSASSSRDSLCSLQWGHASSAWITRRSRPSQSTSPHKRFNGATLLQRGSLGLGFLCLSACPASMGPRFFSVDHL
jgi:hypothetical protein